MAEANHVNLPTFPEFTSYDDPEVSTKWEDWLEGLEAMLGAMKMTEEKHHLSSSGKQLCGSAGQTQSHSR